MIQKLDVQPGHTLECVAWLRQRGNTKKWYAKCLWRVIDPHAEILVREVLLLATSDYMLLSTEPLFHSEQKRWMELSLPPSPDETMRTGYPTIKQNANEALRLITVQAKHCNEGCSLEDLALVMQLSQESLQELILQLQLNAQIYQNEFRNYVPL